MGKKTKILIIDDEEDICHFLKSGLERTKKFEVLTSTQADRGIVLAKTFHPDLILLDISMPEMDGSQVAEALRADTSTKDIPVVFLTALARKEEVEEGSGMIGGHLFIAKPVETKELIDRIESILNTGK